MPNPPRVSTLGGAARVPRLRNYRGRIFRSEPECISKANTTHISGRVAKMRNMMADNKCTLFVTFEAVRRNTLTTYIANDFVLCRPNGVPTLCLFSDQNNETKTNTQALGTLLGQGRLLNYRSIISGGRKHLH